MNINILAIYCINIHNSIIALFSGWGLFSPKMCLQFCYGLGANIAQLLFIVRVHAVRRMLNAIVAEEYSTYNRYLDVIFFTWKNHPHVDPSIQYYICNKIR